MSRYSITPQAREDLYSIIDYVQQQSSQAAEKLLDSIENAMDRLGGNPGIGHLREDLHDETLRIWPVHSILIVYRFDVKPIQIIRILHGARDLGSILEA